MNLSELERRRTLIGDGIEIHHVEAGTGDPVVFVHGGFGDLTSWAPQWQTFVTRYRCISYSRRYSAPNDNTASAPDHSVFVEAQDLDALLDAWKVRAAILVGTSYGAYTALQLALTSPQKVRALALTEPPVLGLADRVPGGQQARLDFQHNVLDTSADAFRRGATEQAVRILTTGINGDDSAEATTADAIVRRMRNARAMRVLAESGNAYPQLNVEGLRALRTPTLLLSGAHTPPVHDAIFRGLCSVMPQALAARVPASGHGAHRDNPVAFNELVLEFLADLPSLQSTATT